ncbi:MAG: glycosyl transferase [Gammaproteobacteria bacterium]|nr:glycosyl transferase [Gammaproteobacteria bacterium]
MNYCTLFNSQYLSRGLALYYSLLKTTKQFHLYIFAFDEPAYQILKLLNLQHATIISMSEFESQDLLKVKSQRTVAEYCWTCTSSTILYCLQKYHLPEVCYLDADLYFWNDPDVLISEAEDYSILITEHRYTKEYDNSALSGKYCVQFMYFKNDTNGIEALEWWRAACLNWCYNRVEDGKFGDQKYLDDWTSRFKHVKLLTHLGGGVAPWNVQQYELLAAKNTVLLKEATTGHIFDLIFYHFHGLKFINNKIDFGGYRLSKTIMDRLYCAYVKELLNIESKLKSDPAISRLIQTINIHCKSTTDFSIKQWLRDCKNKMIGIYNKFSIEYFKEVKHG